MLQKKQGGGPLIVRNASFLSSKEICQTIADIKISKVALTVEEIENILDTLVYDGKVEKSRVSDGSSQQLNTYRAVERLLDSAGIVRLPCGICPVSNLFVRRHTQILFSSFERSYNFAALKARFNPNSVFTTVSGENLVALTFRHIYTVFWNVNYLPIKRNSY